MSFARRTRNLKAGSSLLAVRLMISSLSRQAVDSSLKAQQQELGQVPHEMRATVTQAVGSIQSELTRQLASQLAGQFEQIQELFVEKKLRRSD